MRRASQRREDGFTLVEMMVTLIVIAVLVAIAVPTFLKARERSQERAAQTRTHTGLKATKAWAADGKPVPAVGNLIVQLETMEPSLDFEEDPGPAARVKGKVYVKVDGSVVTLVSKAQTGQCFWTMVENGATSFAETSCDEGAPAAGDPAWGPRW
ncbi:MAG TPA: type II secretion system protein [Acidimicrobiales bacterium]